ncbi:hypothetical protein HaLaN_22168, partial [Haematococcus lacustris]
AAIAPTSGRCRQARGGGGRRWRISCRPCSTPARVWSSQQPLSSRRLHSTPWFLYSTLACSPDCH